MEWWEIILLILAIVVLVFVSRYCTYHRFRRKKGAEGDTPYNINPIWGGVAAAVIVWLICRNVYPWLADNAKGDGGWWNNDWFRLAIISSIVLSIGYLVWVRIRRKTCQT